MTKTIDVKKRDKILGLASLAIVGIFALGFFAFSDSIGRFTASQELDFDGDPSNPIPQMRLSFSPQNPTSSDSITFSVKSKDYDGYVTQISIYLDNVNVKNCVGSELVSCEYTSQPLSRGEHSYHATTIDNTGKIGNSDYIKFRIP